MKPPPPPRLETRRAKEFKAELLERARAWIPSWGLADGEPDFGRALLDVAARFSSEVAERLDRAGRKMRLGFLDWLAVRGQAARAARMPVVFKLADNIQRAVTAVAPTRLQAAADDASIIFETESDVRLIPGRLEAVVGVDADKDAYFLPPPKLSSLEPIEPAPAQWQLKSFASAGATKLQLDPDQGLAADALIEAAGRQYRIEKAENGIATIEPPLEVGLDAGSVVRKVAEFAPFDGAAQNRQEHALYLGDMELLNIEAAATIEIEGASTLREGFAWEYWGKRDKSEDDATWQPLTFLEPSPQRPGNLRLEKGKGAVEPKKINNINSRWIRAYRKTLLAEWNRFESDEVRVRVNPDACNKDAPCVSQNAVEPVTLEGFANTTPLVLEGEFFPFGREPRQFDAFYIASKEAFSKRGASARLCFELAGPTFDVLACQRMGSLTDQVVAGVAKDRKLYLLRLDPANGTLSRYDDREPLSPPSTTLDPAGCRTAIWGSAQKTFVAVPAADSVWVWREDGAAPAQSGWENTGQVGPPTQEPIVAVVYLADGVTGRLLFALRQQRLWHHDLSLPDSGWTEVDVKAGANQVDLATIAPIFVEAVDHLGPGELAKGIVGVDGDDILYGITLSGATADCTELLADVSSSVTPAAVRRVDKRLVVVAADTSKRLVAFRSDTDSFDEADRTDVSLEDGEIIGNSIDVNLNAGDARFVISLRLPGRTTALGHWKPFDVTAPKMLSITTISAALGEAQGAATLLPHHVLVPDKSSRVLVAGVDPARRLTVQTTLRAAVIASSPDQRLRSGDQVAIPFDDGGSTGYGLGTIANAGVQHGGEVLQDFDIDSTDEEFFVYPAASHAFSSIVDPAKLDTLVRAADDSHTDVDTILLVRTDHDSLYQVTAFDPGTGLMDLDRPLELADPANPPATVEYRAPERPKARLVPSLKLDPATTGNWDASLLGRTHLVFIGAKPRRQLGTAFIVDAGHPILVALSKHWITPPTHAGASVKLIVDGTIGEWSARIIDDSSNPALSWEYWNGTGWWTIDGLDDGTLNLKRTGKVTFTVPDDIRPSDWSGKTNHWIRARLIGGDYGRERVTVVTTPTPPPPGSTEQTIVRSIDGIRAPSVLRLTLAYGLCRGVRPTYVVARDSGTYRNQSDANKTPGALVEAFVPVAVLLGRLSDVGPPEQAKESCPEECSCGDAHGATTSATTPGSTSQKSSTKRITGRSMLLGLSVPPSEAPVNVLLIAEAERNHDGCMPMKVDALVADRFEQIVVKDRTRALGESGVLSMTFELPPTPRELFGQSLSWVRLTPSDESSTNWKPAIKGVYLNGVWAEAAETLTRELVGSSDGSPGLTLVLARPPVLHESLQLRVKEPLGEEERKALVEQDKNKVLSAEKDLAGDWVLWEQVPDPTDAAADERVYALDEATGEIKFGNGEHGMIPPVGRDVIVAFAYRRTELGEKGGDSVPANEIKPRTALNLISPIEGVEGVFAADQAAGGAPPESVDRVDRFGTARVRHRGRAVTGRDLEDLALQSSPAFVQAQSLPRRGGARLVVVARGTNPVPSAAALRDLGRTLREAAPPALGAHGALRVEGPRVRKLRIDLELSVSDLEHAGGVFNEVKERIGKFFETAGGGVDQDGWRLGAEPAESDIAYALLDVPHLESIGKISFDEIDRHGDGAPWPGGVRPSDLVVLADDPLRMRLTTVEAVA